jgi:hypothetical protein
LLCNLCKCDSERGRERRDETPDSNPVELHALKVVTKNCLKLKLPVTVTEEIKFQVAHTTTEMELPAEA